MILIIFKAPTVGPGRSPRSQNSTDPPSCGGLRQQGHELALVLPGLRRTYPRAALKWPGLKDLGYLERGFGIRLA